MKKYWLVLYPDTFLWLKNGSGLLYNSKNFKHFTFSCIGKIKKLCDTLVDLDNLYSTELTETLLLNQNVKQWVDEITGMEAGELIEQNGQNNKLTSYYPVLTIQNNVDHIRWKDELNMGGEIIKNLDELIFYINGSSNGSDEFYKQAFYPLGPTTSIDFELIESFVKKCRNGLLKKITFIGDLSNYKDFDKLQKWILDNDYFVHLVLAAGDIDTDITKFKWFTNERIEISIVVNNNFTLSKQFELFKNYFDKVKWIFPVTSITQFESVNSIIDEKELNGYDIVPLYTGNNKTFFEENIYTTQDEFNDTNLSRREIFINMALNVHNFGKLTIMPDCKVYSNVNEEPLGNIDTPIYDMIFKEMTEGKSWLNVRDDEPCCNCVYQWLCPSPGNYEHVIGKPNLCHYNLK